MILHGTLASATADSQVITRKGHNKGPGSGQAQQGGQGQGGAHSQALAQIEVARLALSQVKDLEDATTVIDKMSAAAAYARAKGAFEAYNLALEIKLRAERKAGEFLANMKDEGDIRQGQHGRESNNLLLSPSSLSDLGIDKQESSRWQRIAKIPEKEFEEYLHEATKRTQSGLLVLA